MMFQEKFVVAVKHNGRVLREQGDTVFMPLGAEYVLYFKNLNSVRALVRVSVDGVDATLGTSLIVPANGSIELERFLIAGQMDKGHKFKFIERTQKIEDGPRGIQAEDGLIRVEFEYERPQARIVDEVVKRTFIDEYWQRPYRRFPDVWYSTNAISGEAGTHRGVLRGASFGSSTASSTAATSPYSDTNIGEVFLNTASANIGQANFTSTASVAGITVPGSVSEQKFEVGQWFPTDGQKHVMVLKIMGKIGETVVEAPVTVKTKSLCSTCGTESKFGTKFCPECGTSLVIL